MGISGGQLQENVTEACNVIDRMVGDQYKPLVPIISKNDQGAWTVSLTAKCRRCEHVVISSVAASKEGWGKILVEYFSTRAEFHTKKHSKLIMPARLRTL
jgi:hypothetical protein